MLEVLRVFNHKELLQFQDFLQSPFFLQSRSNEHLVNLLEQIIQCFPDFSNPKLLKENVYNAVFPEKPFQKGKLEKVMSALLKEVFRFISYKKILEEEKEEGGEVGFQLKQACFLRERQLDKYYNRSIDQLRKKQEQVIDLGEEYYFNQYLIERERFNFATSYNARKEELNIPNTIQSLDVFYFAAKLEYSCGLLAQNQHLTDQDQQNSLSLLEEMLPKLEERAVFQIPLIQAYAFAFKLLLGKEKGMFEKLKEILEEKEKDIPLQALKALQALSRNYCILKYNSGEGVAYLEEAFRLYKLHLEKGYLYYEGGLIPSTIRNLVIRGLKLKEYPWVYDFLQKAKNKIAGTKHPNDVYSFNMACYYFSLGDYDKSLVLLTDTYEDVYYKVTAKRLEIMIRYEQDSPLTDSRLDAFKVYIFRSAKKSISAIQKEGNNNFADLLKQVLNPKTRVSPVRINKLLQKIKEKKIVAEKDWLIEKLEALAAKN